MDYLIPITATTLAVALAVLPREYLTLKSLPVTIAAATAAGMLVAVEWRLFINLLGWLIPAFAS